MVQLVLELLVLPHQVSDDLIVVLVLEVVHLALELLNVLLGPLPNGPLGFSVVGSLAGKL